MGTFAFLDLDGTLVRSNLIHIALHHGARRPTLLGRAAHVAGLAASSPALAALDKLSRTAFQDLFFRSFEGLSRDRLRWLGEHAAEHVLQAHLRQGSLHLLDRIRAAGQEPVLLTGNLEHVVAPFARSLGIEHYVANRLELRRDRATGRLAPPLRTGVNKAGVIRRMCAAHEVDAEACHAWSDSAADLPMLAAVGHPCAVHPDVSLRSEARAQEWPILELDPPRPGARPGLGSRVGAGVDAMLSRMVRT